MRYLVCISALVAMAATALGQAASPQTKAAAAQTKAAAAKRATAVSSWTQPKTPWGDPDLQGTWTSDDCIGTPLQRPANLGEKLYLTEEDLAQRQQQLAKQRENDNKEFVASDQRVGTGPPGHWGERA